MNAHCLPGKSDKARPVGLILTEAGRGNMRGGCELFVKSVSY